MAPPVALNAVPVESSGKRAPVATTHAVGDRPAHTGHVEAVIGERVLPRVGGKLLLSEPGVRHRGLLAVHIAAKRKALHVAQRHEQLHRGIVHHRRRVGPGPVPAAPDVVGQHAGAAGLPEGAARLGMHVGEGARTAGHRDPCGGTARDGRREIVDHATDGLGPIENLSGALEHLDGLHALDGRMVIRGVVTIGGNGERDPVLKQQHLRGARGVEPAHADVGPEAKPFLVADHQAGHFAECLVGAEDTAGLELRGVNPVNGAGDARQAIRRAHHRHPGELERVRSAATGALGVLRTEGGAQGGDGRGEHEPTRPAVGDRSSTRHATHSRG